MVIRIDAHELYQVLELQDFAGLNEQVLLWLNAGHCPENRAVFVKKYKDFGNLVSD